MVQTQNSSPIDRAPGARSKSDEFSEVRMTGPREADSMVSAVWLPKCVALFPAVSGTKPALAHEVEGVGPKSHRI